MHKAPRWTVALLRRLARRGRSEDLLGDLEEAHQRNRQRHGALVAHVLTGLEALHLAFVIVVARMPGGALVDARMSGLDVKLGLRMMAKYPGLSLVAVLGLSLAIALGAGWYGAMNAVLDSKLPLDEGDRVISIRNREVGARPDLDQMGFSDDNPDRQSLHDFFVWRAELKLVHDLGAFRTDSRNLVQDGTAELVLIAEMTASGFRVARVSPHLGRTIAEDDERESAPLVIVIAYEEWQERFQGDPNIVGRPVLLGKVVHTVVGVMPEGFRFPLYHRYWIPFRLNPLAYDRGRAPAVNVFGRLAGGVSLEKAQAELSTIGLRMAAEFPATHGRVRATILPYVYGFSSFDNSRKPLLVHLVQNIYILLLLVVSVNVAILIYARTATRTGEIAVRSALGASRTRVVTQLFVEALVLSLIAAAIGLTFAATGLGVAEDLMQRVNPDLFPFWLRLRLSAEVVVYAVVLAILAAAIVGVLPALQATGRRLQAGLQQFSSRGSQMQLGRTWTTLIIVQVAIAVAVMPSALYTARQSVLDGSRDPGYPADEFMRARLSLQGEETVSGDATTDHALQARFRDRADELLRRLEAEPAVAGVTFASDYPGQETWASFEIEQTGRATETKAPSTTRHDAPISWAAVNRVDVDFFTVFAVPVLAGRPFVANDGHDESRVVIINREFAERIVAGGDVLGRRIRHVTEKGSGGTRSVDTGPWLEIVGVVPDFPTPPHYNGASARLYHPMTLAQASAVMLAVRIKGAAPALPGRLRKIAAAIDPTLQLHELRSMAEVRHAEQQSLHFLALAVVAVTLSVLLLSAAGIYAMMSFTVTRRRREIGIRVALGADSRRVLTGIFARSSAQLGAGVLAGLIVAGALGRGSGGEMMGDNAILLPGVSALMLAVGLLATLGPARRGLAVQPTEALREE